MTCCTPTHLDSALTRQSLQIIVSHNNVGDWHIMFFSQLFKWMPTQVHKLKRIEEDDGLQNADRPELMIAHLDSELGGEILDKDLACIVTGTCIQFAWVAKSHDDVCALDLVCIRKPNPAQ